MSVIIATEEGIEIDGVLLKDTVDLKAYIGAHAPEHLQVGIGAHPPSDLEVELVPTFLRDLYAKINIVPASSFLVSLKLSQPESLQVDVGINPPSPLNLQVGVNRPDDLLVYLGLASPESLNIRMGALQPKPLEVFIHGWVEQDVQALVGMHLPVDLRTTLGLEEAPELRAVLSSHSPKDLLTSLFPIPYINLYINIRPFHTIPLYVTVGEHPPKDLSALLGSHIAKDLIALINPMYSHSFKIWFFTVKEGLSSLWVYMAASRTGTYDLNLLMHIWEVESLSAFISGHPFSNLGASIWVWTPSDINVAITTTRPPPLTVGLLPQPEDGVDLKIIHGFYGFSNLQINLTVWTELYNLRATLWGVYITDLPVSLRMGGSSYLEVPLPMTTGYSNLYVTCAPASRIMSTFIPVYTMEIKDLYISINQSWPCGFGSSYALLTVTFDYAYLLALTTTFKVIHGSSTDTVGVFINKAYFDTYINKFDFSIFIPEEAGLPSTYIFDSVDIIYDNAFDDIYQDIMQVTFDWPRIRLLSGSHTFSVELLPYRGDKTYELAVVLYANRQTPLRQPTSRPLKPRETDLEEPIWPDVFQVHEIELWGDDPPEVVRKVEIKFEEQIHEYYWVSSEQKAMSKRVYERWAFLTRGYLPSAEYSGQIDYVTMRSLSSMVRYDTVDQAIKAMIANFLYNGVSALKVVCSSHGGYSNISARFTIRDYDHMRNLNIIIEPMHTKPLSVNLIPV